MDKNYFGLTDTGKVRDNNEDTFIAEKTAVNDLVIACVIDGVGGYSGGEIASDIAKRSILRHLNNPGKDLISLMKEAIVTADHEIITEKQKVKEHENMACVLTLVVADLNKNLFYYAHVGDTRLYLLRDRSLIKISKDQSFVGFMEDTGRLTEEQAMRHPKRNEINKALGFGTKITAQDDYIETGQSPFLPGDMLLVCSDGLSDMVNKQEIADILAREGALQDKCRALIDAANRNGGLDNITVVLVKTITSRKYTKLPGLRLKQSGNNLLHYLLGKQQVLMAAAYRMIVICAKICKGIIMAIQKKLCSVLHKELLRMMFKEQPATTRQKAGPLQLPYFRYCVLFLQPFLPICSGKAIAGLIM